MKSSIKNIQIISVEKYIYDNKDDSGKVEPKFAVESWRKRKKLNYISQVKQILKINGVLHSRNPRKTKKS